ncbi:MAG: VPS10 domain-containing protein [Terriglobales bacterium]
MMKLKSVLLSSALATLAIGVAALPVQAQFFRRSPTNSKPMQFQDIGPALAGGRVSSVVGVPGNPNIYYAGTAGGGVWKSSDGGNTWKAIFTHEATSSIGAVALAPSNPNLVWVATGEPNIRNDVMVGHGLYFSSDAGATFTEVDPSLFHNAGQMSKIVINPHNPDEVWVAVLGHAFGPNDVRGVYKTTDGGTTWKRTLFVNDHTGAIALAMQPGNPEVLLAGMWDVVRHPWGLVDGGPGSGLYRSTDGGDTWTKITKGLDPGPYGRIGVGFAPSAPDTAYAIVQSKKGLFYTSTDAGLSWTPVSDSDATDARPFYFSRFVVAPNNPDKIYFLSTSLSYSTDGGKTLKRAGRVHADNHSMWIDPDNPHRILEGNDGGVYLSYDAGLHFRFLDTMPIEEDYMVSASNQPAYNLCAGLQDNNAWCGPSSRNSTMSWSVVAGGDGQYAVFAPSDPKIVYAESQSGSASRINISNGRSTSIIPYELGMADIKQSDLKYRFDWTTPIAVSPTSANSVYIGANVLFHSTDGGYSWRVISPDLTRNDKSKQIQSGGPVVKDITGAESYDDLLSIGLSPTDPSTIWTGADDGTIEVTHNGGKTWTRVDSNIQNLPPWGRVQQIDVSPFSADTAYVAIDRHMSDDNKPYVYKTGDSGKTWTSISAGLPQDNSARVIREDPNEKGLLFVGTDTGLFYSRDDGSSWTPLKRGFPTVPVYDIQFVKKTHDLLVATHGRGIYALDDIIPLEKTTAEVASAPLTLFPVLTDYDLQGGKLGGGYFGGGGSGAHIDYNLGAAHRGKNKVTVAITDSHGNHVTTLSGTGHQGLNEVTWRGNYDGPVTAILPTSGGGFGFFRRHGTPGKAAPDAGPHAVPGLYTATITVAGLPPQKETVRLAEDPRWPHPADAIANAEQTLRMSLAARDQLSALNELLTGLQSMKSQLKAEQTSLKALDTSDSGNYGDVIDSAKALAGKVSLMEYALFNPDQSKNEATAYLTDFQQQFQSAYRDLGNVTDTPPRPTDVALWHSLEGQLRGYLSQYNGLLRTDAVAYNKLAVKNHAITLAVGEPITLPAVSGRAIAARNRRQR